jgi:hypothetical protein
MSHSYFHSVSSANAFGGVADDYLDIHAWFDRSRGSTSSILHRMLAHHTAGIQDAIAHFGATLTISTGRRVPVSLIGEQHITEDLGFVPTLDDYIQMMTCPRWTSKRAKLLHRKLHENIDTSQLDAVNSND